MDILVTNNPLVEERYRDAYRVEYLHAPLIDVLIRARDHIHKGCLLLTHPLSGGVKPNETPYKSVLISVSGGKTDERSLHIIEECIKIAYELPPGQISDKFLADMRIIDLALIEPALEKG